VTKGGDVASVALGVGLELALPKCDAGFGRGRITAATMTVPKAAVNEYGQPSRSKYDIRISGQIGRVKAKSQSETMKKLSHDPFRRRVLAPNSRHQPTAPFGRQTVHNVT
jgi:hypothetical protein